MGAQKKYIEARRASTLGHDGAEWVGEGVLGSSSSSFRRDI